MPNGGTDNCMNCAHNRANQPSANVKTALRDTREPFCSVHQIPIWNRAWTYCSNIGNPEPDVTLPIQSIGLSAEGYARIPWFGRTQPTESKDDFKCAVCGSSGPECLVVDYSDLGLHAEFCSNEHYQSWRDSMFEKHGFNAIYSIGRTSIHQAVLGDYPAAISLSEVPDIDVDAQDSYGWTALHLASYFGNSELVKLLLEKGSSTRIRDKLGLLPIDLAGSEGHSDVVQLLVEATFSSESEREESLLKAANDGNLELVEAHINLGVSIECKDYRGRTPLLLAVWGNHYTTTVFLLDHGANVHVEDEYGNSPVKTVDTWKSRNPSELHRLIHEWIKKSDAQDPS